MKTTKKLLNLVDEGEIESKFELGYRLAFGKKTYKNPPWKEIFKYWKPAAESGHLRAMFYIGVCYDKGYGIKRNIPLAFEWYLKAAKLGHRDSQYNIGYFYDTGELVRKNYKKKIYWYSLAAEAGLTDAQRDLGYSYFMGEGVKKDILKLFIGTKRQQR